MEEKICTKCCEFKSFNEYHKHKQKLMGVNPQCIECIKTAEQIHLKKNKEKLFCWFLWVFSSFYLQYI